MYGHLFDDSIAYLMYIVDSDRSDMASEFHFSWFVDGGFCVYLVMVPVNGVKFAARFLRSMVWFK